MTLFKVRAFTFALFCSISALSYYLLEGYSQRFLITLIPLLFGVQLLLADTLEGLIITKIGFGTKWFTFFLAPGTILHELSHLIAAISTGCEIVEVKLFSPNPKTGVLGYVSYTQRGDKYVVFREFLVGLAPFFGCGMVLFGFNYLMGGTLTQYITYGPITSTGAYGKFVDGIFASILSSTQRLDLRDVLSWIFIYLQFCFSVGAAPSSVDLKGAFGSLYKHIFSAIFFLIFLSGFIMASEGRMNLGPVTDFVRQASMNLIMFVTMILTLSTIQLGISIPLAYTALNISQIKGISKTIPLTASVLTFISAQGFIGIKMAFGAALLVLAGSIILLKK